jgi:hypothetical protein
MKPHATEEPTMYDAKTQCPDCGAQLVVNLRGRREFTCGREDEVAADSQTVVRVTQPCRTSEIARHMGGSVSIS